MKYKEGTCELCDRPDLTGLSFHHLIPQKLHNNKWFRKNYELEFMRTNGLSICRECHHAIHDAIPKHKDLGRLYNTKELLLQHEKIANHVKWISRRSFQRHKTGKST